MTLRTRASIARSDVQRRVDDAASAIARRLPRRLRAAVVTDACIVARDLYPDPDGYAGPDGLGYAELWDGANRRRTRRPPAPTPRAPRERPTLHVVVDHGQPDPGDGSRAVLVLIHQDDGAA